MREPLQLAQMEHIYVNTIFIFNIIFIFILIDAKVWNYWLIQVDIEFCWYTTTLNKVIPLSCLLSYKKPINLFMASQISKKSSLKVEDFLVYGDSKTKLLYSHLLRIELSI